VSVQNHFLGFTKARPLHHPMGADGNVSPKGEKQGCFSFKHFTAIAKTKLTDLDLSDNTA
jgi:hypothetical protein